MRTPWPRDFPEVVIHSVLRERDAHPGYGAAKAGDAEAALELSRDLIDAAAAVALQALVPVDAILLPVTALEVAGFNAIPDAMAQVLLRHGPWKLSAGEIAQINTVGHTRAKSFNRLVMPAEFGGAVRLGATYVLIDDHVGHGGTLANLKGFLERRGARVAAMTTLTESRDARRIALQSATLSMLQGRHGKALDSFWREEFGYGVECLTDIEAGVLCRELSLAAIKDRMAQAAIEVRSRGLVPSGRIG